MKKTFIFILLGLGIFINGCSQNNKILYTKTDKVTTGFTSINTETVYINYNAVADEAVTSIFKKIKVPNKVIVTDFVDITSLDNHSRLGYVLSNNIKNSLINNFDIEVIEAEVSKYFKISGNGLKILSREIEKLRSTNFKVQHAIVGTYTYTDNELILFVKLIDLKTGIILGSYANSFPMGSGTKMMLLNK